MPIVGVNREGGISIHELRRGFVPYWAKDVKIGYKAINARADSVDDKPMFYIQAASLPGARQWLF